MHILTRYVLAELVKVFLISLVALTLMMIIVGVVREASQQSLPLAQIVQLLPFILPEALTVAVPVTLLLAVTSVYGRFSGSNEVVAVKALGISPMKILWPAIILAFLLSLTTVKLNDLAVSWGRNGARSVVIDSVEEIAYSMLRMRHRYSSPNFAINVKGVEGRRLLSPTISIPAQGNTPPTTITADWAELRSDHERHVLKIVLHDAVFDMEGRGIVRYRGIFEREIELRAASRANQMSDTPSWMPLRHIAREKIKQKKAIEEFEQEQAARAAYQMLCGDFEGLSSPEWKTRAHERVLLKGRLYRLDLEPHRRWSAGFSCLCFAWVGAPLAILLRKSDFLAVFFICFLPILIVYYPLMIYGIDGAKGGTVPAYGVWSGNLLLLACGEWLRRKVIRY
jgi:lipopolysaccharide export system permease protein